MRRRGSRLLLGVAAAVLVAAPTGWLVVSHRLTAGVAAFLAAPLPPSVRIDAAMMARAWRANPAVELGAVTVAAGGWSVHLDGVRVETPLLRPGALWITAATGRLEGQAGQVWGTATSILGVIAPDGGSRVTADLPGVTAGPGRTVAPVRATLGVRPPGPAGAAGPMRWTLDTTGEPPIGGIRAAGTADATPAGPGVVTIERLAWDGLPDVSATARLTFDASSRDPGAAANAAGPPVPVPVRGSATLRAKDGDALLTLLRRTLASDPRTERTITTLVRVASSFSVGDLTVPMEFRGNLVTVMGVPVARLGPPSQMRGGPGGTPTLE